MQTRLVSSDMEYDVECGEYCSGKYDGRLKSSSLKWEKAIAVAFFIGAILCIGGLFAGTSFPKSSFMQSLRAQQVKIAAYAHAAAVIPEGVSVPHNATSGKIAEAFPLREVVTSKKAEDKALTENVIQDFEDVAGLVSGQAFDEERNADLAEEILNENDKFDDEEDEEDDDEDDIQDDDDDDVEDEEEDEDSLLDGRDSIGTVDDRSAASVGEMGEDDSDSRIHRLIPASVAQKAGLDIEIDDVRDDEEGEEAEDAQVALQAARAAATNDDMSQAKESSSLIQSSSNSAATGMDNTQRDTLVEVGGQMVAGDFIDSDVEVTDGRPLVVQHDDVAVEEDMEEENDSSMSSSVANDKIPVVEDEEDSDNETSVEDMRR